MEAGENPAQARCRVMNLKKSFCKDTVNPPNAIGIIPEKADDFLIESKYFPTDKNPIKTASACSGKFFKKSKRSFAMKNLFKKIAKNFLLMALITAMSLRSRLVKKKSLPKHPPQLLFLMTIRKSARAKNHSLSSFMTEAETTHFSLFTPMKKQSAMHL